MNAEPAANGRNQVNRNKVDSVHQGDPNENGQSQRSDKRAVSVNNGFSLFRNHIDEHFNCALPLTWDSACGFFGCTVHEPNCQQHHKDRENSGVEVKNAEVDNASLLSTNVV